MGFSEKLAERVLVDCGRCCALCHKFCGIKIELHHITPPPQGGEDTYDNCIPLCFDCHADVGHGAYNSKHPKGRKYTESELIKHRDAWYKRIKEGTPLTSSLWGHKPDTDYNVPAERPYLSVVKVYAEDDRVSSLSVPGFRPVVCLKNTGKCIIHYKVEGFALSRRLRTKEKYPAPAHASYENLAYPCKGELGIDEAINFFAPIYEIDKIGEGNRYTWLESLDNLFDFKITYREIDSTEQYSVIRSYQIKHKKTEGYVCNRVPSEMDS